MTYANYHDAELIDCIQSIDISKHTQQEFAEIVETIYFYIQQEKEDDTMQIHNI